MSAMMRTHDGPSSVTPVLSALPWAEDEIWNELGPVDHARLLHERVREGNAILASREQRTDRWFQTPVARGDEASIACCARQTDTYIAYNTFRGRRRTTASLVAIGALFADIDHYKMADRRIAALSPETAADLVLAHLASRNLPLPSIVLDTGRGVALTWLIDPIPPAALPRWNACQRALRTVLAPFGHDAGAIDAARCTRLIGTRNSANGRSVRMLPSSTLERFDFEALAGRLLLYTRVEIVDLKAARRVRTSERPKARPGNRPRRTVRTLHEAILTDLRKLVAGRYGGTAPSSRRNEVVLIAANSLSYLVPTNQLHDAVVRVGAELAGWTPSASLACAASVIARAQQRARHPDGAEPRYRYSVARIVADLAITEDEMRCLDLRVLRTKTIAQERDRVRKGASRRTAGCPTNAERYDEHRRIRQRALDLSAGGMTAREVAEAMGETRNAVKHLLRRAKAESLTPNAHRQEQLANALEPDGGSTRVPVDDGKPHPSDPTLKPTTTDLGQDERTSNALQLDLFGSPASPEPWSDGIMPVDMRIAARATLRTTCVSQDKLAMIVGLSRPQLTNVIAGRFGTCSTVAQRLSEWVSNVATSTARE